MQIGFCDYFFKDHLPTIFMVFVLHGNVKDICTYLNILRTEGQVLCPAKHGSKESRELSPFTTSVQARVSACTIV